jgi:maleylacetoacetate isomerase
MSAVILYDFWRSSASYRVRIALNLAGIDYTSVPVDLTKGDHKSKEHIKRNPQGFVPALHIDGCLLTQSLAIAEYLHETRPGLNFLPADPAERGRVRAIAYAIAMDIHPICNLGVVNHVMDITGGGDPVRLAWMQKFIGEGLAAVEAMLQSTPGPLCFSDTPTLADICLVPQVYNARRWEVDLSQFQRILDVCAKLDVMDAFARAHPDRVKPAP